MQILLSLAPAAVVVFAVGLLDDLFGLSPRFKLVFEALAASLAVAARLSMVGAVDRIVARGNCQRIQAN